MFFRDRVVLPAEGSFAARGFTFNDVGKGVQPSAIIYISFFGSGTYCDDAKLWRSVLSKFYSCDDAAQSGMESVFLFFYCSCSFSG